MISDPPTETTPSGYTVAYGREMAQGRVYGVGGAGIVLLVTAVFQGTPVVFALGLAALGFAVYYLPLVDTTRARIGATQYGIFIEGLGLIGWRDISEIKLVSIAVRTMMTHELHIKLVRPIPSVLLADWRNLPWYRLITYLPWRMSDDNVVRIPLDQMSRPPEEIERSFTRLWNFHRHSKPRRVAPGQTVPEVGRDARPLDGPASNGRDLSS